MKKRRFVSIFAAFAFALSFAGCQKDSDIEQTTQTSTESQQVITSDDSFEIIDWSIDEITDSLKLNETEFSLPCDFTELQQKFSEDDSISFSDGSIITIDNDTECYESSILFDGNEIGTILYNMNTNEAFGIYINVYCENYTTFSFDNVKLGETTKEQIYNEYGKPTRGEYDSDIYLYLFGERKDITFVYENDIVQAMTINNISSYNELIN